IEIIENFHMIRDETNRDDDDISDFLFPESSQVIQNIGLQPGNLRWSTAALPYHIEMRHMAGFCDDAGCLLHLCFIFASLCHRKWNGMSGKDDSGLWKFL